VFETLVVRRQDEFMTTAAVTADSTGSSQTVRRRGLGQATEALREPVFRWWFGSQILSASGAMTQSVASSWLILQLTGHAVDLGVGGAITWAPILLGGAWAGALVDRFDRRRILLLTQVLFILLSIVQTILVGTGAITLWMIYALGALTGVVTALDGPARQVYVMELVGRARLVSAVSLYEVILNASRVLGPAAGGLLLATVGTAWCFALNAVSYLPPLLVLLAFRPREAAQPREQKRAGALSGIRQAWSSPVIRSCLLIAIAGGLLFNLGVALPVLATKVFHLGGGGYGLLMAAFGLGAIPGALVAASGAAPDGRRLRVLAALAGLAVLATAVSPVPGLAFVGIAAAGFLSIWLIAVANTLVQLRADAGSRGRIMGVWTMALPGTVPLTGLLSALVSQAAGGRAGFALAGVALAGTAVIGWRALGTGSGVPADPSTVAPEAAETLVLRSTSGEPAAEPA
jgi:MFS family permease